MAWERLQVLRWRFQLCFTSAVFASRAAVHCCINLNVAQASYVCAVVLLPSNSPCLPCAARAHPPKRIQAVAAQHARTPSSADHLWRAAGHQFGGRRSSFGEHVRDHFSVSRSLQIWGTAFQFCGAVLVPKRRRRFRPQKRGTVYYLCIEFTKLWNEDADVFWGPKCHRKIGTRTPKFGDQNDTAKLERGPTNVEQTGPPFVTTFR